MIFISQVVLINSFSKPKGIPREIFQYSIRANKNITTETSEMAFQELFSYTEGLLRHEAGAHKKCFAYLDARAYY